MRHHAGLRGLPSLSLQGASISVGAFSSVGLGSLPLVATHCTHEHRLEVKSLYNISSNLRHWRL